MPKTKTDNIEEPEDKNVSEDKREPEDKKEPESKKKARNKWNEAEDEANDEAKNEDPAGKSMKPSKASTKTKGGMGKRNKIIVGAIIALIIAGGIGYYIYSSNPSSSSSDPVAKISVLGGDPDNLPAGTAITFDGSGSDGKDNVITDYQWDFRDGQKASGKKLAHTYTQEDDYAVILTVTTSAGTDTASITVHVVGTAVALPVARIGDTITYDISGYVDLSNPDGFWTYTYTKKEGFIQISILAIVKHTRMDIAPSSLPRMVVTNDISTAEDGFSEEHSCLTRQTNQEMGITGTADVTLIPSSGPSSVITQDLAGDGHIDETVYTDLNVNRTVTTTRTDTYNLHLTGGDSDSDKSGSDTTNIFPKNREEFNVDALRANRTFRLDDSGEHTFGKTKFYWTVEAQENVQDKTCLKVHITMDPDAMSEAGLSDFDMYTWISNDFSMPLKMYLHSEGTQNGNTVILDYSAVYKSATPGTEDVPYGTCTANTPDGHFYAHDPDISYTAPAQYAPEQGNAPSLGTYPLADAINYAKANSAGSKSYLDDNPDAFLICAYYNSSGSVPKWNLTFGVLGATTAYNVIVSQSSVIAQGTITVSKVGRSVKEISESATFEGAETVLQGREDTQGIYSSGKIDTDSYSFGSKADIAYPKAEIPISMNVISSGQEYYFFVESSDGTFFAGLDSQTGQTLYVKTHSGS